MGQDNGDGPVQEELEVKVANWAFSFCASFPFCKWKLLLLDVADADADATAAVDVAASATAAEAGAEDGDESEPEPVTPPVAPVAWIRASASASVVHVIEVPAELTSGSAKHCVGAEHWVTTNVPPTH